MSVSAALTAFAGVSVPLRTVRNDDNYSVVGCSLQDL